MMDVDAAKDNEAESRNSQKQVEAEKRERSKRNPTWRLWRTEHKTVKNEQVESRLLQHRAKEWWKVIQVVREGTAANMESASDTVVIAQAPHAMWISLVVTGSV